MVTGLDLSVMRDIWPAMRGETGLWSCFSSAQTLQASRGGSCLPEPVTPITSSSFGPCVSCHRIFGQQTVSLFKWYSVNSLSLFRRWNHLRMMLLSFCHFISICIIYKIPFWWLPSRFFFIPFIYQDARTSVWAWCWPVCMLFFSMVPIYSVKQRGI